jgi:c(7)-type cytochrome triheme protein
VRFFSYTFIIASLAVLFALPLPSSAADEAKNLDEGYTARKAAAWSGHGRKRDPNTFGDVLMGKELEKTDTVLPVVFSHLVHRLKYTCSACHSAKGSSFKAGEADITHKAMDDGKFCATCHNDRAAFASNDEDSCIRCHSYKLDTDESGNSDLEEIRDGLAENDFGNQVDWAREQRKRKDKLDSGDSTIKVLDSDIIIPAVKMKPHPPDVLFPHKAHTLQLTCANCHPAIFKDKQGANTEMHMLKIIAGQYCGTCHGTVSFPLEDCFRCHSQPAAIPEDDDDDEDDDDKKDKKGKKKKKR